MDFLNLIACICSILGFIISVVSLFVVSSIKISFGKNSKGQNNVATNCNGSINQCNKSSEGMF